MSREVPSFISAGMVTASSAPASHTEVLSSDATGAIVVPSGGAYAWMGSPVAPVFIEAGTLIMSSLPALSSSSSTAIAGGSSTLAAVAIPQNHQWALEARSIQEEVTAQQAAEDEAADDAAWQEALAPPAAPYTIPEELRAAIIAQTPAPFVGSLSTESFSPEQLASIQLQTQRFQQHVREQVAAQQAEASREQ